MSNKYEYFKVIQQHTSYGWEDVSHYETDSTFYPKEKSDKLSPTGKKESLLSHDMREYRLSGGSYRVIGRRELNTNK